MPPEVLWSVVVAGSLACCCCCLALLLCWRRRKQGKRSPLRIGLRQFTPRDQRLRRNASNLQRAAESADGAEGLRQVRRRFKQRQPIYESGGSDGRQVDVGLLKSVLGV